MQVAIVVVYIVFLLRPRMQLVTYHFPLCHAICFQVFLNDDTVLAAVLLMVVFFFLKLRPS